MDLDRHSFISMKDQGNKIYTHYCKDEQLTVDVYVQHLTLALLYYKRAKKLAKTPIEKSSIRKNLAVVQLCIAKKLLQRKRLTAKTRAQKRKQAVVNPSAQAGEGLFFLEESMDNYDEAIEIGKPVQAINWLIQLTEKQQECAELLWSSLLSSYGKTNLNILLGKLHQLCLSKMDGSPLRAQLFLKLGRFTFQKAIDFQEQGKAVESLQLLGDNTFNIEEAKKMDLQMEWALELEESNYLHVCIGEAAKFRQNGDKLWKAAISQEESVEMELVWDAVDLYVQSIVSSRGKCIESEAIAHSHLGRLFEVLFFNQKARDHYRLAIDLGLSMHPKTFDLQAWYKQATAGLQKLQQQEQYKENKEKERIRGKKKNNCYFVKMFSYFFFLYQQLPFARSWTRS